MDVFGEGIEMSGESLREQVAEGRDYETLESSALAFANMINELLSVVHQILGGIGPLNPGSDLPELTGGLELQRALAQTTMEETAKDVAEFIRTAREIERYYRTNGIQEAIVVEKFAKHLKQLLRNATRLKCLPSALAYHQSSMPHPKDSAVDREELCVSQCLTAVTTAVVHTISGCLSRADEQHHDHNGGPRKRLQWWWDCLLQVGHLVQFESLLSTFGDERGMIADFSHSIRILEQGSVSYKFHCLTNDELKLVEEMPDEQFFLDPVFLQLTGPLSRLNFSIGLPAAIFQNLPDVLQAGESIALRLVLFSQGINEQQLVANMGGHAGLQQRVNAASLRAIESHLSRWRSWAGRAVAGRILDAQEVEAWKPRVAAAVDQLRQCVHGGRGSGGGAHRSADVLHAAAWLTRNLASLPSAQSRTTTTAGSPQGVGVAAVASRVTSCKSAKDRTAMSVTLEQTRLVSAFYEEQVRDPAAGHRRRSEEEDCLAAATGRILSAMRGEMGTRLRNVEMNLGLPYLKGRYAFNGVQWRILGPSYRPPYHVIGSAET